MIPALWLDLINARDPNTPSSAMSPTFPEGPFPMNLPACKTVGSETYLFVSIAEAKVAGSSPKAQAVPGDHLPPTPRRSHSRPLPSAAATHSHHGRHWITRVFTHFIVETIPARVEEAGEGKGEGSVGRKENSCVNINYFLKYAHPTPPKKERGKKKTLSSRIPDSALTLNRPCFPTLDGLGRGR